MAINFPNSPTSGQIFTSGSTSWIYDGIKWGLNTNVAVSNDSMPVGSIMWYSTTTTPSGWLPADGAAVSRTTYATLFALISTTYGVGDGSTTFNVPSVSATTGKYFVRYTTSLGAVTTTSLATSPVGTMLDWPVTSSYPTGFLRADGSAVSRTSYADLFALIGTTYGTGDGSTTFNLPNLVAAGSGSPVTIIKASLGGTVEPSTVAHASSHTEGGSDVVTVTGNQITGYQSPRNNIINGAFSVDQRNAGASQTFTAAGALAYNVDRWYGYCTGANVTGARVAGAAPFQYYYRFTGAASNTAVGFGTRLEAADTYHLSGQTCMLSAYLASSTLTTVTWNAYYATTADSFGTLASPTRTSIATGTFTITSSVTRYTASVSVPAAATTGIEVVFTTGALVAAATLTFGGVQLEKGSVATPFEFEPFETTLRKCQRYYYKTGGMAYGPLCIAFPYNTTGMRAFLPLPITMRIAPTGVAIVGTAPALGYGTFSSLSFDRATTNAVMPNIMGSGFIAGGGNVLYGDANGTTYIEVTGAEL